MYKKARHKNDKPGYWPQEDILLPQNYVHVVYILSLKYMEYHWY